GQVYGAMTIRLAPLARRPGTMPGRRAERWCGDGTPSDADVLLVADDRRELVDDEARPADECAVDVGLTHEAGDVRRLHRTAVEDAGASGRVGTQLLGHDFAELGADVLGLFRRRRL